MVNINLKKLPPVTEGYSWPLPKPPVSMWTEVMTCFSVLYGVISRLWFLVPHGFGMLGSGRKGLNWKKTSPDSCRIHSSEILDFGILPDSGY